MSHDAAADVRKVFVAIVVLMVLGTLSCRERIAGFSVSHADRKTGASSHPVAIDPARVGSYPGNTKSGAGYFYDDVLEYRVWMHPERGARRLAGSEDYFAAFARYESALEFANRTKGAEAPLVLVRQREHINEPEPGRFEWVRTERVTEWKVEWLADSHREPDSIARFLQTHTSKQ